MTDSQLFEEESIDPTPSKRPVLLLVLVILTAINIGIASLGSLSGMLGVVPDQQMIKSTKLDFAKMRTQLEQANAEDFIYIIDQMEGVTLNMFRNFQAYNSLQFLFLVVGFVGIVLMYRAKKLGFHFYIIYTLGTTFLPYFFNPLSGIPTLLTIFGVLNGGFWVFLYSRNLHWLQD